MNVGEGGSVSPELAKAARNLLAEAGAREDAWEEILPACRVVFQRFHEHLQPRLGEGGFRALLELAHRRSVRAHPVLEKLVIYPEGDSILQVAGSFRAETEGRPLVSGLVHFLGNTVALIRHIAKDQDWELVDPWPGLGPLEKEGVPLQPAEDNEPGNRTSRGEE